MSQLQQLRLLVMAQLVDNWDPEMVSIKWDARNSLNNAEGRIYKFTLGGWEQERRIPLLLAWARGDGCLVSHGGVLLQSITNGLPPPGLLPSDPSPLSCPSDTQGPSPSLESPARTSSTSHPDVLPKLGYYLHVGLFPTRRTSVVG